MIFGWGGSSLGDEMLEIGERVGRDGEVLRLNIEHVEAAVGNSCQDRDKEAYQTADSQGKWQGHANESSEAHLEVVVITIVGSAASVRLVVDVVNAKSNERSEGGFDAEEEWERVSCL